MGLSVRSRKMATLRLWQAGSHRDQTSLPGSAWRAEGRSGPHWSPGRAPSLHRTLQHRLGAEPEVLGLQVPRAAQPRPLVASRGQGRAFGGSSLALSWPGSPAHPQLVSSRLSPTCSDAMPKSAIRMLFFSSSRRFSGFRSLWLGRKAGLRLTSP